MKRLLLLAVVLLTTACTPRQVERYFAAKFSDDPTISAQADPTVDAYLTERTQWTAGRPCAEWYDYAVEAGFLPDQWPTVSRLMWAESNCQPTADSSLSTARGLMQILAMWTDDCGGTYPDLFNPVFNLACAKHIHDVQGWPAWSTY